SAPPPDRPSSAHKDPGNASSSVTGQRSRPIDQTSIHPASVPLSQQSTLLPTTVAQLWAEFNVARNAQTVVGAALPAPVIVLPKIEQFEIVREIGRGGMGVVYEARQPKLNRTVALKMILSSAHADAEDRARFRIEAEAVAKLQHPNIVQIYELGEH